jgi:iron complex transport system substrate-binding protein
MMAGGNWMPELIKAAGGENLFGTAGAHSGYMQYAELAAADPDVIIVAPCGFDLARTRQEMPLLTRQPGWHALAAVRNGRVALGDGNRYFNRPGPGLAETTEIIAEILHSGRIDYGHQGRGWVSFEDTSH